MRTELYVARQARRLTLRQLAKLAHVAPGDLSKWERNLEQPHRPGAQRLAHVLGIFEGYLQKPVTDREAQRRLVEVYRARFMDEQQRLTFGGLALIIGDEAARKLVKAKPGWKLPTDIPHDDEDGA